MPLGSGILSLVREQQLPTVLKRIPPGLYVDELLRYVSELLVIVVVWWCHVLFIVLTSGRVTCSYFVVSRFGSVKPIIDGSMCFRIGSKIVLFAV